MKEWWIRKLIDIVERLGKMYDGVVKWNEEEEEKIKVMGVKIEKMIIIKWISMKEELIIEKLIGGIELEKDGRVEVDKEKKIRIGLKNELRDDWMEVIEDGKIGGRRIKKEDVMKEEEKREGEVGNDFEKGSEDKKEGEFEWGILVKWGKLIVEILGIRIGLRLIEENMEKILDIGLSVGNEINGIKGEVKGRWDIIKRGIFGGGKEKENDEVRLWGIEWLIVRIEKSEEIWIVVEMIFIKILRERKEDWKKSKIEEEKVKIVEDWKIEEKEILRRGRKRCLEMRMF